MERHADNNGRQRPLNPAPVSLWTIPNIRGFLAFRLFFNCRFYYPVFTILFLDFGLNLSQFALLNAVWAGAIVLLEVPSGALADTIGRRNLMVAAGVLMVLEMGLLCVAPQNYPGLMFAMFLLNRVLSGAAEAAASGADEAIAYDTLKEMGRGDEWGRVLEMEMRVRSIGFIFAMSLGAALYDARLMQWVMNRLPVDMHISPSLTIRLPLYLTLVMALLSLWAALRITETAPHATKVGKSRPGAGGRDAILKSFRLTFEAGRWILRTPFVLVVIAGGLLFDSINRMVVTIGSEYYRQIDLPEATFGLIGSGMALLGLLVPRLGRQLVAGRSPRFNLAILSMLTLGGLWGISWVIPFAGLIPMMLVVCAMYLLSFFQSHYLNRMTDSAQRATVLSFKGLSFNLAYGTIGILYAVLVAGLRPQATAVTGVEAEAAVFVVSLNWFPLFFMVSLVLYVIFARRYLKHSCIHKQPLS